MSSLRPKSRNLRPVSTLRATIVVLIAIAMAGGSLFLAGRMTGRWLVTFPPTTDSSSRIVYSPVKTSPEDSPFLTSGWQIRTDVISPFEDRVHVDLAHAEVNEDGVAVYRDPATGTELPHPIVIAQYAESALLQYSQSGDEVWLDRAIANANELVNLHSESDGAWWFQYDWDWTYHNRTLSAPWWSGMAQGEALTVFSKLTELQPENPQWREAADQTWHAFLRRGTGNSSPWVTTVIDGRLWFEEYAGDQPPLEALNGHIFAIFGLYEYYKISGDQEVARYLDGGATAVLEVMPLIRSKGATSYYCAQQNYCQNPAWMNEAYHPIHIQQLDALARVSGDQRFNEWADLLREDTNR